MWQVGSICRLTSPHCARPYWDAPLRCQQRRASTEETTQMVLISGARNAAGPEILRPAAQAAKSWWAILDLNQWLLPCEDSALPLS